MEFVRDSEVMDLLTDQGVARVVDENAERVYLQMGGPEHEIVRLHLATAESSVEPLEGARVITVAAEALPDSIEGLIHALHLHEVILVPVGKWRHLFDAVAFSLASNEDWQAFDAAATVELNTRDPLLCEPGDFHTVIAFLRALLTDAEQPEQGVMLTTTSMPLLVEVVPAGAIRMNFGSQVLADEVAEALAV